MELEQNYIQATNRLQEMQEYAAMKEKEKARMDSKMKSLEKRLEESERQKKDLDKENQLLRLQVGQWDLTFVALYWKYALMFVSVKWAIASVVLLLER